MHGELHISETKKFVYHSMCMCVCICIYICAYVYVCMYVCMYVCILYYCNYECDVIELFVQDASGCTPLYLAARSGYPPCCRILIEFGADSNLSNHAGQSALTAASDLQKKYPTSQRLREMLRIMMGVRADVDSSPAEAPVVTQASWRREGGDGCGSGNGNGSGNGSGSGGSGGAYEEGGPVRDENHRIAEASQKSAAFKSEDVRSTICMYVCIYVCMYVYDRFSEYTRD